MVLLVSISGKHDLMFSYSYILYYLCLYFVVDSYFCHFDAAPEVVEKPGDNSLARLKFLYTQAKELSESEARYV